LIRAKARRVAPEEEDLAGRRLEEPGKEIEQARLPRAVRADEGMDLSCLELKIDAVHRAEPRELFGDAARLDRKSVRAREDRAGYRSSPREGRGRSLRKERARHRWRERDRSCDRDRLRRARRARTRRRSS